MLKNDNQRLALKLAGVTVAMFGFGFAMVPLYNVFCDITGLNGKTGRISASAAAEQERARETRLITVEFDTNVNGLPWDFRPKQQSLKVRPGELREAVFVAANRAGTAIVGRAVPSVAPAEASVYFNKTECFCFSEQTLAANEQRDMPLRFVIDPDLPEEIEVLTLSYTFFLAPGQELNARVTPDNEKQQL